MSNIPQYYEKPGVKWIRKFVQNGDLVNRLFKKDNTIDTTIKNKNYAEKYLKTVSMYEKYHVICFVFFCLSGIFAIFKHKFVYFILIMAGNILYNLCPVILQQYNRARILRLIK
ncbi:glycosyl-4,4'-diaponeurosporenoate acyltransferase CrtO family protein [Dyadobacter frigoris]|uniref:glycosyl-4,4'-diaponeurosporenoate acyltransferase CrtO family protein n=1 Tax=Dyadobacter frigoris TaxID=2576211 RepID=UPI0035B59C1C